MAPWSSLGEVFCFKNRFKMSRGRLGSVLERLGSVLERLGSVLERFGSVLRPRLIEVRLGTAGNGGHRVPRLDYVYGSDGTA